jgi:hypothetical protein
VADLSHAFRDKRLGEIEARLNSDKPQSWHDLEQEARWR